MQHFKQPIGAIFEPIPGEVWVPVVDTEIKIDSGLFISSLCRIATLHVAPNPFTDSAWVRMRSVGIYIGNAGPVVEIPKFWGELSKKRYMLSKLFINTFFGYGSYAPGPSPMKDLFKSGADKINLKTFGNPQAQYLYRKEHMLDEDTWKDYDGGPYRIWPSVLGLPKVSLSEEHRNFNKRTSLYCDYPYKEIRDGNGLRWRMLVKSPISEIDNYWISATGQIIQITSPIEGLGETETILPGVNCNIIRPKTGRLSRFVGPKIVLPVLNGSEIELDLRKLVYSTFVDPNYPGEVETLDPFGESCSVNMLYKSKSK